MTYHLNNISYSLLYNNHYQSEMYVDDMNVRVQMGIITVLIPFSYKVTDQDSQIVAYGKAYARSFIDPSSFEKTITQKDNKVEWQPKTIEPLSLTALITV